MAQILIVDDDERLTAMLRRTLNHAGWTVTVVGAGDDLPSVWGVLSGSTSRVGVA